MLNCKGFFPESHAFNLTGRFENDKHCLQFIRQLTIQLLSSSVVLMVPFCLHFCFLLIAVLLLPESSELVPSLKVLVYLT